MTILPDEARRWSLNGPSSATWPALAEALLAAVARELRLRLAA